MTLIQTCFLGIAIALTSFPAWAEDPPAVPDAETLARKVAAAHGIDAWPDVTRIAYTFHAVVGDINVSRSWVWEPQAHRVTLVEEGVTYTRDQREDFAETDAKFINDEYWLIYPFHLVWDDVTLTRSDAPEPIPGSSLSGIRLTAQYPDEGGYTPGDAYDLYLNPDHTVRAWVYRKGGAPEPTRIAFWQNYKTFNGLRIALDHPGPDPDAFRITFTDVTVE